MAERRVTFPIIGDDEVLQKDTRVILTNKQLITRNPSLQEENDFGQATVTSQKTDMKKRGEMYKPYKAKVSYSTQHRPLNSVHSGVSSFDKMPKKTSVDESKERAKRAAATPPKPPKPYVSPLDRPKEQFNTPQKASNLTKHPLRNDNPIQDMKRRGMNISDAMGKSGMKQGVPRNRPVNAPQEDDYFTSKRKNIFDRGNF